MEDRNKKGRIVKGHKSWNKGKNHPMYGKHHTEETKKKMSQALKGRNIGDKNPAKRPEVREKIRLSKLGNKNSFYGKKHTKEARKKQSLAHKGKLKGIPKSEEHKQKLRKPKSTTVNMKKPKSTEHKLKLSKSHKKLWQNEEFAKEMFKRFIVKPNKPEKQLINLIEKNNLPFNYVGNGKIWFGGFNPDFLSKNPKHIIEIFGNYWHNLPKAKKRDKERLVTYKKYGYKTLVIWASELNNPNQVLNKIKEFIN